MKTKRVKNKLLKSGYLPKEQTTQYEKWIDVRENGTFISFYCDEKNTKGPFQVHGRKPDEPEIELFYSRWTDNLSEAIRLSRC